MHLGKEDPLIFIIYKLFVKYEYYYECIYNDVSLLIVIKLVNRRFNMIKIELNIQNVLQNF